MAELKERKDIPCEYKWDIESMYANEAAWEADVEKAKGLSDDFASYAGELKKGDPDVLLKALETYFAMQRVIENAYVYAAQKKDEDSRLAESQSRYGKIISVMTAIDAKCAFFEPELLEIPEATLRSFAAPDADPARRVYAHFLDGILREKAHVLSMKEETILSRLSEVMSAPREIFGMINNADMKFGEVVNEDGETVELTHGNYGSLMESHDRAVRKNAFETMYAAYTARKNTLAATYNYNVKKNVTVAELRNYPSAREASCFADNVPVSVYDNLIDTIHRHLPAMYRYVALRKKILGVDELHMYDVYTPLVEIPKRKISFEEAVDYLKKGLAPLGEQYVNDALRGIGDGWIDRYENRGKRSGAYSFGSYDSKPFILLNFDGKLDDVFTLVHEMGHSINSLYTRRTQPFVYGDHSIFTAEVASTVNENLLMNYLLDRETDPAMLKYLLNHYLEEFKGTVFRQTMFAEFEKMTHEAAANGETLTAETLAAQYADLNATYFGPEMARDAEIAMEWSRIPHFYRAFYVYKYATGFSAATALAANVLSGERDKVGAYLRFLATGSCDYPIELLKDAGVDMSTPEPVEKAMRLFESILDRFEALYA